MFFMLAEDQLNLELYTRIILKVFRTHGAAILQSFCNHSILELVQSILLDWEVLLLL